MSKIEIDEGLGKTNKISKFTTEMRNEGFKVYWMTRFSKNLIYRFVEKNFDEIETIVIIKKGRHQVK